MGSAAQMFNQQLVSTLKPSKISLLSAGSLIKRMMVEQPDLIRFSPNKIDEALTCYRNADTQYDKALNRGFYELEPESEWKDQLTDEYKKISTQIKSMH